MDVACGHEVSELHDFLQAWLTGTVPGDAATFARFEGVMGDGLLVISPRGTVTERLALLTEFEASYGVLSEQAADFRIWVANYKCVQNIGDHALVMYEEWHSLKGEESARLSTVLFERRQGTPNEVAWLHVHETWLPDRAPVAGERYPEPR